MQKIHVVAWEYGALNEQGQCEGGGGGFDWFWKAEAADRAFEEEKANCVKFASDNWTAARYDVEVEAVAPDEITREIDDQCMELFDAATIRYRAAH